MTTLLYSQYGAIAVYLVIAIALSGVILAASYAIAVQTPDTQKLTAYECGFDPFDDARSRFDVRFYLVAILFIVFDLEARFRYPWARSLGYVGDRGFWVRVDFLVELTIGYLYAWQVGALEWA